MSTTASDANSAIEGWRPFIEGLHAFIARRVPGQDIEDVFQDVILRLHRGASSLRDAARAESWVYGVARRAIADFYRARAASLDRAEPLEEEEPAAPEDPRKGFGSFHGTHSVHEEVLSWLEPMARALPESYREALMMADFEGRAQSEVARKLGLSLSGAKSRIQRARRMLREELHRCCEVHLGSDGEVVDFRRRDCDC